MEYITLATEVRRAQCRIQESARITTISDTEQQTDTITISEVKEHKIQETDFTDMHD